MAEPEGEVVFPVDPALVVEGLLVEAEVPKEEEGEVEEEDPPALVDVGEVLVLVVEEEGVPVDPPAVVEALVLVVVVAAAEVAEEVLLEVALPLVAPVVLPPIVVVLPVPAGGMMLATLGNPESFMVNVEPL